MGQAPEQLRADYTKPGHHGSRSPFGKRTGQTAGCWEDSRRGLQRGLVTSPGVPGVTHWGGIGHWQAKNRAFWPTVVMPSDQCNWACRNHFVARLSWSTSGKVEDGTVGQKPLFFACQCPIPPQWVTPGSRHSARSLSPVGDHAGCLPNSLPSRVWLVRLSNTSSPCTTELRPAPCSLPQPRRSWPLKKSTCRRPNSPPKNAVAALERLSLIPGRGRGPRP